MAPRQFTVFTPSSCSDLALRQRVAARLRAAGFQVDDENGPFGSVIIFAEESELSTLSDIEEVRGFQPTVLTAEEEEQYFGWLEELARRRASADEK